MQETSIVNTAAHICVGHSSTRAARSLSTMSCPPRADEIACGRVPIPIIRTCYLSDWPYVDGSKILSLQRCAEAAALAKLPRVGSHRTS
jgi:hypothetical protein